MTREQKLKLIYRHFCKDYKGRIDGKPSVMIYRQGTCIVMLDDLTDDEIAQHLPSALRKEGERKAA